MWHALDSWYEKEWGKAVCALGLIACVVVMALSPLFSGKVIFEEDVTNYYLPAFKFYSDALRSGEDPSLVPTIFSGFPLALTQVGGYLDPLNNLLFSALPFLIAYHTKIALNYILAGFFTYLFARSLRLSVLSSLLAGFAFMTAQYIVPGANILRSNSYYIMPALFFAVHLLWIRSRESWGRQVIPVILGVSTLVISFLGGYTQLNIYSLVAVVLFTIFLLIQRVSWRFVSMGVVILVSSVLLLLPYFKAVFKLVALSSREGGLSWEVASLAVGREMYTNLLSYHIFFPQTGDTTLQSLYIGTFTVFFFFVSVILVRKNHYASFFWLLALLSFLSAFPYPLFVLWHKLPVFELFRFPPHWFFVTSFTMSVLAGLGMEYVRTTSHALHILEKLRSMLSTTPGSVVMLVILILNFILPIRYTLSHQTVPSAVVFEKPWLVNTLQNEEGESNEPYRLFRPYAGEQVWFLVESRYEFDLSLRSEFNREYVQTHLTPLIGKIDSVSGFDNLEPRRYSKVRSFLESAPIESIAYAPIGIPISETKLILSPHLLSVLGMMNVKYLWSLMPLYETESGPSLEFVQGAHFHEEAVPMHLFKTQTFIPRVHVPQTISVVDENEETFTTIIEKPHDFKVEGFIECDECDKKELVSQGTVDLSNMDFKNTEVRFVSEASDDAWVIVSNSKVPGWVATVDGASTPIRYANYIFQGIRVPKGKHEVKLTYYGAYDIFSS